MLVVQSLVVASYYKANSERTTSAFVVPAFGRMLTSLRFGLWAERIKQALANEQSETKIMAALHAVLQTAA